VSIKNFPSLPAFLLCNKAPKYSFVTTSINISKRDLGVLKKKKKEEKKNKRKRTNVPT
jgi:hypothetical protein